jgi:hypothetical protein
MIFGGSIIVQYCTSVDQELDYILNKIFSRKLTSGKNFSYKTEWNFFETLVMKFLPIGNYYCSLDMKKIYFE